MVTDELNYDLLNQMAMVATPLKTGFKEFVGERINILGFRSVETDSDAFNYIVFEHNGSIYQAAEGSLMHDQMDMVQNYLPISGEIEEIPVKNQPSNAFRFKPGSFGPMVLTNPAMEAEIRRRIGSVRAISQNSDGGVTD